jgi:hypothetical protein
VNGLNLITQFFKYVYTNWLLPIGNQWGNIVLRLSLVIIG